MRTLTPRARPVKMPFRGSLSARHRAPGGSAVAASRREFVRPSSAYSLGFLPLRYCVQSAAAAGISDIEPTAIGYGPLVDDPEGLLDLPAGFSYKIVSRAGDLMDDGLFVPGKADGMATFAGPGGTAIIIRNHEM